MIPSHQVKSKQDMMMLIYNISAKEAEQRQVDISGLLATEPSRIYKPHDPVKDTVSKNNVDGTLEEFHLSYLWPPHTCTNTHHFCACVGWEILVSESWNTEHF